MKKTTTTYFILEHFLPPPPGGPEGHPGKVRFQALARTRFCDYSEHPSRGPSVALRGGSGGPKCGFIEVKPSLLQRAPERQKGDFGENRGHSGSPLAAVLRPRKTKKIDEGKTQEDRKVCWGALRKTNVFEKRSKTGRPKSILLYHVFKISGNHRREQRAFLCYFLLKKEIFWGPVGSCFGRLSWAVFGVRFAGVGGVRFGYRLGPVWSQKETERRRVGFLETDVWCTRKGCFRGERVAKLNYICNLKIFKRKRKTLKMCTIRVKNSAFQRLFTEHISFRWK